MKKYIIILLLSICTSSFGQNLISNGSFEQYDSIPYESGQIKFAKDWKSSGGSPDYFHQFSTIISGVNIPYTFVGTIPKAFEGISCAGICCYMENWDNYREYLTQKLKDTLQTGKYYTINLNVLTVIPQPIYGGWTADNIGILLSKAKPKKGSDGYIDRIPTYTYPTQLFANTWRNISTTFYNDSAYKYITIGCFVDDITQQRHHVDSALLFDAVYIFIDNVSIVESTSTGIPIYHKKLDNQSVKYDLLGNIIYTNDYWIKKETILIK